MEWERELSHIFKGDITRIMNAQRNLRASLLPWKNPSANDLGERDV